MCFSQNVMQIFQCSRKVDNIINRITNSHVSDTYCFTQAKWGTFSQTKWSTPATKQPYLLANLEGKNLPPEIQRACRPALFSRTTHHFCYLK